MALDVRGHLWVLRGNLRVLRGLCCPKAAAASSDRINLRLGPEITDPGGLCERAERRSKVRGVPARRAQLQAAPKPIHCGDEGDLISGNEHLKGDSEPGQAHPGKSRGWGKRECRDGEVVLRKITGKPVVCRIEGKEGIEMEGLLWEMGIWELSRLGAAGERGDPDAEGLF